MVREGLSWNHRASKEPQREGVITEVGVREERDGKMLRCGFKDGGWGHEPRDAGGLYKLEKTRKQMLPQGLQEECSPPVEENEFASFEATLWSLIPTAVGNEYNDIFKNT